MDTKKIRKETALGVVILNEMAIYAQKIIKTGELCANTRKIEAFAGLFSSLNLVITYSCDVKYYSKKLDALIKVPEKTDSATEHIEKEKKRLAKSLLDYIDNLQSIIEPCKELFSKMKQSQSNEKIRSFDDLLILLKKIIKNLSDDVKKVELFNPLSLEQKVKEKTGGIEQQIENNIIIGESNENKWIGGFQTGSAAVQHVVRVQLLEEYLQDSNKKSKITDEFLTNLLSNWIENPNQLGKISSLPDKELLDWIANINKINFQLDARIVEWNVYKDEIVQYIKERKKQIKPQQNEKLIIGSYESTDLCKILDESEDFIKQITDNDVNILIQTTKDEFIKLNSMKKNDEDIVEQLMKFEPQKTARKDQKEKIRDIQKQIADKINETGIMKWNKEKKEYDKEGKKIEYTEMLVCLNKIINFELKNKDTLQSMENNFNQLSILLEKLMAEWKYFLSKNQFETCIVPIENIAKNLIGLEILPRIMEIRFNQSGAELRKKRDEIFLKIFNRTDIIIYKKELQIDTLKKLLAELV